jgi:hypothetical protein
MPVDNFWAELPSRTYGTPRDWYLEQLVGG